MGAREGAKELYPSRFDENGHAKLQSCPDSLGVTLYGADACKTVIDAYKASAGAVSALYDSVEAATTAGASCKAGNASAGAAITVNANGAASGCDLVEMDYGLV